MNGVPYGVPQGRGANVLIYNKDKVKTAPTSLAALFTPDPATAGHLSVYDSPISIADAAVYLMSAQPGLGIKSPYALDQNQFDAAVALLTKQRAAVSDYWTDTADQQAGFSKGADLRRRRLAGGRQGPAGRRAPGHRRGQAAERHHRLVRHLDGHLHGQERDLRLQVAELHHLGDRQRRRSPQYFGEAPANAQACAKTKDPKFCAEYHADDTAYWTDVYYWTTPTARCLDDSDRTCVAYPQWVAAWNRIKQQ